MTATETRWDPIEGTLTIETPPAEAARGIAIPQTLRRLPIPLALAAMIWVFVAIARGSNVFIPMALFMVCLGAEFLMGHLANDAGRQRARRARIARDNNWSYTGAFLEPVVTGVDGAKTSPRMNRIRERVPELVKMQPGAFIGAEFDGEFWGSFDDGRPFWIALGTRRMEAALAADPALRRDRHGGAGGQGLLFSLLAAYRLDRATGIRAVAAPENLFSLGPLDRDIKTESEAFNRRFRVAGHARDDPDRPEVALRTEVLRVLSPAAQTTMLDLADRYRATGFVVDDDVFYLMAQDTLSGANARPDRVDLHLAGIVEAFRTAALAPKRYVE
ncbi:hypothetical protein [Roseovarius salinarum]|uniref:hypothetical protein n=1 Tax=Roseovarius salinarum TaxID=1981892 RepID=UPI000C32CCCE|nr:hypothetical protein [Roseovarius salinarum]